MEWNSIFKDPDLIGESEYRAIHDCVADATMQVGDVDTENEISSAELQHIISVLENFRGWTNSLLAACISEHSVVITARED